MGNTKSRERTNQLDICYPKNKPTVYLTATSNYGHKSVHTDDGEEGD